MFSSPARMTWLALCATATLACLSGCSTDTSGLGPLDGGAVTGTGGQGIGAGGGAGSATAGSGGITFPGSGGAVGDGGAPGGGGESGTGGSGTGGMGIGGGASGGAASGGRSGSGGRFGAGGATGTGGTVGTGGAAVGKPECQNANDCRLQSDCCTCAAVPVGTAAPACSLFCIQSKCSQQDLPEEEVDCVAGRCVAGFNCDTSRVMCRVATPACPVGQVPAVDEDGGCYSGGCVPATQCASVTSCAVCGGANQMCVTMVSNRGPQVGTTQHCVGIPEVCRNAPTCGCMGPSSCTAPNTTCADLSGVRGIACTCSGNDC